MKDKIITKEHGYGGRKSRELVEELILPRVDNMYAEKMDDAAELNLSKNRIVFTTDGYVVDPYFFPGGNIGKLAAGGTINDVIAQGGVPKFLSASVIVEEGFLIKDLQDIIISAAGETKNNNAEITCGDLKVVEEGGADGIYITTAGIGERIDGIFKTAPCPGDLIVVTGPVGEHGGAVFQARNNILETSENIKSDCRGLIKLIPVVKKYSGKIKFMRDPTRGGLAGVLLEMAKKLKLKIEINERKIPVKNWVKGLSYITGIDYNYLACEGRMIFVINEKIGVNFINSLEEEGFEDAKVIGKFLAGEPEVVLNTSSGGSRNLNFQEISQIPRIC